MGRRAALAARALALAVLTLACCELAARIVLAVRGGPPPAVERSDFLARLPAPGADDDGDDAIRRTYGMDLVLHPFYGYTFRPNTGGANNAGFFGGGATYPYERRPGELVVGIFGGSVAMQLAARPEKLVGPLEDVARRLGRERVRLLSFAMGGWRQPQSFHALAYHLSTIDVAIVLDGFNEVIHLSDWHLARQPASYPWSAVWAALARRPTRADAARRAARLDAAERAARLTRLVERPVLRSSALVHLAWRAAVAHDEAVIRQTLAADEAEAAVFLRDLEPATTPKEIEARRDTYFAWWEDLVRYSDAIAELEGRLLFHFVQPNQYDRGAKPLSAEEREHHTRNAAWFDEVTPRYRRAEAMTERLRAEGVASYFLGRVFAGTTETVYVDECCHLNERGLDLLAGEIAARIVASGRLAALAARAPGRAGRPSATRASGGACGLRARRDPWHVAFWQ